MLPSFKRSFVAIMKVQASIVQTSVELKELTGKDPVDPGMSKRVLSFDEIAGSYYVLHDT
jgi:hypothetical protein